MRQAGGSGLPEGLDDTVGDADVAEDVAGAVDIVDVAEEADRLGTVVGLIEGRVDGDFIDLAFGHGFNGEISAVNVGIGADARHAAQSHSLVVAEGEIKDI